MNKLCKPNYNHIIGVSKISGTGKWKAYINETYIGTFNTKSEAVLARLKVEDIFKNVISKLNVDDFVFRRDTEITLRVVTDKADIISISTGILYSNGRKPSIRRGVQ